MAWVSGGCACGAIRYQTEVDPVFMVNCHCRDCQRGSGSAFAAIAVFPKTAVAFTQSPRFHKVAGESGGGVERGFCPDCGSPLAIRLQRLPDIVGVQAGSLDDPSQYKPAMNIFTANARSWDCMDPALPGRPRGTQG